MGLGVAGLGENCPAAAPERQPLGKVWGDGVEKVLGGSYSFTLQADT